MIVGLIGRKQSGKTTVSQMINLALDKKARIVPMAEPLKLMLSAAGVPMWALHGTEKEKNTPLDMLCGKTGRQAMQTLGTEWGRDIVGMSLWTNIWKERVKFLMEDGVEHIICDDIRRYDEATTVDGLGGYTIMVTRAGDEQVDQHASERYIEQLPFHYKIENDGTMEDLKIKVAKIMEDIREQEAKRSEGAGGEDHQVEGGTTASVG